LNNVAFAVFHIVVLSHGVSTAVFPRIVAMTPLTDATPVVRPAVP
jgi:hypothetical protein